MKAFNYGLVALTLFSLLGCQTTNKAIGVKSENGTPQCGYEEMASNEYMLSEFIRGKYITNVISSVSNSYGDPQFNNKEYFAPLAHQKFKFTDEEFKNAYYYLNGNPKVNLKSDTVELNGVPYTYRNNSKVKIITEGCLEYWFERGTYITSTVQNVEKADGGNFILKDYFDVLGKNNLSINNEKATIEHDKFTNTSTIKSSYDNKMLLRAWYKSSELKKPKTIQLYADVVFLDSWGHLDTAYTDDSNVRKLTKIGTDVDCSGKSLIGSCYLTETVGVEIPVEYLENKKDGFEVKVMGSGSKVIKVKGYLVKQMLDALASL